MRADVAHRMGKAEIARQDGMGKLKAQLQVVKTELEGPSRDAQCPTLSELALELGTLKADFGQKCKSDEGELSTMKVELAHKFNSSAPSGAHTSAPVLYNSAFIVVGVVSKFVNVARDSEFICE